MIRKTYLAPDFQSIYVIGVGGTGGYLAEGLAKMLSGYKLDINVVLVDPDVVEEKNCARQNFMPYEIGQLKAKALSTRLNQQYGLKFGASPLKGEVFLDTVSPYQNRIIVTCVDTIVARKKIKRPGPWLDIGNGETTGQAIFGTTSDQEVLDIQMMNWTLSPNAGELPSPYLVGDMENLEDEPDVPSCADQPFAEQGVFVNEWAAQAGLAILFQLLITKEVKTPRIYFDATTGRMSPMFITKDTF